MFTGLIQIRYVGDVGDLPGLQPSQTESDSASKEQLKERVKPVHRRERERELKLGVRTWGA